MQAGIDCLGAATEYRSAYKRISTLCACVAATITKTSQERKAYTNGNARALIEKLRGSSTPIKREIAAFLEQYESRPYAPAKALDELTLLLYREVPERI